MKQVETLADLDARAAELRARVHSAAPVATRGRTFTITEIAVALDFANVPSEAANRTIALLTFLASLP